MGLHRAGFDVTGVDIKPQPRYPFRFVQADALMPPVRLDAFDLIWASPPCQRYIQSGTVNHAAHPDLLGPVREVLESTGVPWIIENVPGAPLRKDLVLCGSMFGLAVRRHRVFETSPAVFSMLPPCDHSKRIAGVYGHPHGKRGAWKGMLPSTQAVWADAMGIDWMDSKELAQAIPPAYGEYLGRAFG